jgi:hypothetical protein
MIMQTGKSVAALATAVLAGVGGLTALAGGASAAPVATAVRAPADGAWPAQVAGRPEGVKAGAPTGYYLWHNSDGWRLEVTHPGDSHVVFAGTISTDGLLSYQRVGDETGDLTRLGADHHVLGFAFNNYGRLDGVHFVADRATSITFSLTVDGRNAGVARVELGANNLHPDRVPFTVTRTSIR